MTITPAQIRKLQAERRKLGMTDDDYRDLLAREAGVRSTKDLTLAQARRLIDMLARENGSSRPAPRARAARMDGPYAAVLRALWISAYNLDVVRSRTDAALIAFCERQTGLSHTRFLVAAGDASKVIEALKKWISREAKIVWPAKDDPRGRICGMDAAGQWKQIGHDAQRAIKIAILERQWAMLEALGVVHDNQRGDPLTGYVATVADVRAIDLPERRGKIFNGLLEDVLLGAWGLSDALITNRHLDQASFALGSKLRKAKARRVAA